MISSSKRGFSLVEVLVVIGLMGVLIAGLAEVGAVAVRQGRTQEAADRNAQTEDSTVARWRERIWEAETLPLPESPDLPAGASLDWVAFPSPKDGAPPGAARLTLGDTRVLLVNRKALLQGFRPPAESAAQEVAP